MRHRPRASGCAWPAAEPTASLRRAAGGWSTRRPGARSAPSSAASAARCPATRLEHLLPERGLDLARCAGRHRGHPGGHPRRDRPAGRRRPAHAAGRARLPVDGRRGRRHPRDAAAPADRGGGARPPHRRRGPAHAGGGRRADLPRGDGWLFVELAGDDRRARCAAARRRMVADAGALDALVVTDPAEAAALWRIREDGAGLAGAHQRRPPGARRLGGRRRPAGRGSAPTCATSTRCCAEHGLDGVPYGHFGDGCVHVRIDFPLATAGTAARGATAPSSSDAARLVAGYGGSHVRRARRRPGPLRAAAADVLRPPRSRCSAQVKAPLRPRRPAQPRRPGRPAPLDADLRVAESRRAGRASRWPTATTAATSPPAVHRCTGVGKCRADTDRRGGVMCPSYQATREEKDSTRGRARVLQEMLDGSPVRDWRVAGGARGARPVPVLQGLRPRLPDRGRHGRRTSPRCSTSRTGAGSRPRSHYALGWLPRWADLAGAGAPAGQRRDAARRPGGALARWRAGVDQRRTLPRVRADRSARWAARPGRRRRWRRAVALWVDSFTDHFAPAGRPSPPSRARGRRLPGAVAGDDACCGLTWITTGQLDAARRDLRRARPDAAPARRRGRPRSSAWNRPALAVLRSDAGRAARRPARRRVAAGVLTLAELLARTPDWTPPDLAGLRGGRPAALPPSAVMGWQADAALLARPAPRSPRSAAAAAWPATSGSSGATTTSRSWSPRTTCCPPSRRRPRRRGAGRRLLLPHPARPARRPAGGHLAELLDRASR